VRCSRTLLCRFGLRRDDPETLRLVYPFCRRRGNRDYVAARCLADAASAKHGGRASAVCAHRDRLRKEKEEREARAWEAEYRRLSLITRVQDVMREALTDVRRLLPPGGAGGTIPREGVALSPRAFFAPPPTVAEAAATGRSYVRHLRRCPDDTATSLAPKLLASSPTSFFLERRRPAPAHAISVAVARYRRTGDERHAQTALQLAGVWRDDVKRRVRLAQLVDRDHRHHQGEGGVHTRHERRFRRCP
jgi:hypothetical protein